MFNEYAGGTREKPMYTPSADLKAKPIMVSLLEPVVFAATVLSIPLYPAFNGR